MKRIRKIALPLVLTLHLIPVLFQITVLISGIKTTSWRLLFSGYPLSYAIVVILPTILCTVFRSRIVPENGFGRACACLLLPTALLNALTCAFHGSFLFFLLILLNCICSPLLMPVSPGKKWQRILSLAVSFVLALPVVILIPFLFFLNDFGATTVVREVKSPNEAYTAVLTDSDQGALGGNTVIEIMKQPLNLFFGTFTSDYHVKFDEWAGVMALSEITFEWLDNETLLYGNTEISITE